MPHTYSKPKSVTSTTRLDGLVALISARIGAGEPIDLTKLTADCPELREQLEMLLPTLQAVVEFEQSFAQVGESLRDSQSRQPAENSATRDQHPASSIQHPAAGLLGDYRILRELGRGGMGVVYEAEQISLGRRVALKVLPFAAMLDRQQLARFKNEARAAATLDHPNIVAIYSVGVERGVHYYAMQLIEGQSLAQVVEQLRAGSKEQGAGSSSGVEEQGSSGVVGENSSYSTTPLLHSRSSADTAPVAALSTLHAPGSPLPALDFRTIARFGIQAAEALDHAHQNGILHRDIKPANLLVECSHLAPRDGTETSTNPRRGSIPHHAERDAYTHKLWITDFGLARMEADAGITMTGDLLGTLRYMSPEQALAKRVVVDHRSDIYSLGITLYELLTLQPAFTGDDRQELLRQIAFEDPRPPRQINPHIPADLETIVLKAIRKDPEHRYATAHDLAEDLRRFLDDKPIKAKPPTWREHVVKWTRRHPALVWAAALFLLATTLISAASAVLITGAYNRASTETTKAKAVSDLLQEMLGSADAAQAKGVDYKVRELLDDFSAGLGNQLTDQPEVAADIHATMGRAYRSVKRPDQAQPHFEKAIELQRQADGLESERLAAILVDGAWNLLDQQRHAEAESQASQALQIYQGRGITGGPLFHALEILQHILISAKRDEDAERVTQEALAVARQSGEEFPDQANLLHRYADMKTRQGEFADAEQFARQGVDMHRRLHADRHPETAWGLKALARALVPQQKLTEAEAAVRESLAIFRHQFSDDHDNVRDTIYQLKAILEARGDKAALEALTKEEAEHAMRSGTPEYHIRLGELLTRQSITVRQPEDAERRSMDAAARSEEAHRQIREAIEAYDRMAMERPDDLDRRYRALDGYAYALKTCVAAPGFEGEVDELNRRLEAEIPKFLAAFPDSSQCQWNAAMCYISWGKMLFADSDRLSTLEHAFSQANDILTKLSLSDPDRPYVWIWLAHANTYLGDVLWRSGRPDDAEAPLRTAMEIYDQHAAKIAADIAADPYPHINLDIIYAHLHSAFFLLTTHREQEAAEYIRQAALGAKQLTEPADQANALRIIALGQLRLGDEASYRATCKALADLPADTFDELTKRRQIVAWCLAPNALDDLSLPVKRAEELAASNLLGQPHNPPFNLGMALYRDGQYDRAAHELEKSIEVYPKHPLPGYDLINYQRLFLAMTKWKQGQRDEARRLLAETLPAIDEEIQNPFTWLDYRAYAEILRREAVALIEPKEADEAVENKTRTNEEVQQ